MAKRNSFLDRIEANQRLNMELQRRFTIQQCEDMVLIAANEAFGFGEERLERLRQAYNKVHKEWAILALEDGRNDKNIEYTKGKLDQRLEAIMGKHFRAWEERYPDSIYGRRM